MGLWHRVARARLAAQVIRRLRHAGVTEARYRAASFSVRFVRDAADPVIIPLDALLAQRPRRRRERRTHFDRYLAGYLGHPDLPATWAEARPLLRPVLRGAVPARDVTALLRRPALPYLSEFVVVDRPETMTYVSADQLAAWGVPPADVFDAARRNLTGAVLHGAATEPVVVRFRDDGDAYWVSHLLLDGWLARLAEQVGGTPVAFAPERGTLLVTADGSAHLPGLFAQVEQAFLTSPRAITPMAYVSDDKGRTTAYAPPPGHPMHDCARRATAVLAMHEYAAQAEHHPGLAPLTFTDDGLSTWTQVSAGALLPRADEVRAGAETYAWAEVEARMTEVPGHDPMRYLLED